MTAMDVLATVASVIAALATAVAAVSVFLLNRLRIRFEENAKYIQDQQKQMLQNASEFSTQLMAQTLKVAPQYAFAPYPQLMPQSSLLDMSLFDRRQAHFAPEKELLAKTVVEMLRKQIEEDENLSIILILDAGSTVFPIFRLLCRHPTFQFDRNNASRLRIITNNLPGVSDLTKFGRIGERRVAKTLFKCRILSGYAHSEYEASLGDQTANDLKSAIGEFEQAIQSQGGNRIKVVSVTTGNYVSLSEGVLARHRNHVEIKSVMLEVGDDVYILAPLGKLLPYTALEVNSLLDLSGEEGYSSSKSWTQRMGNITMVVTIRKPEYFIQLRPHTLHTYFAKVQGDVCHQFKDDHLVTVPFDPMDDIQVRTHASVLGVERALREHELPHQNLRDRLIARLEEDVM